MFKGSTWIIGFCLCVSVMMQGCASDGQEKMSKGHEAHRILMVVTSQETFPGSDEKTGLWLEEFAAPYRLFRKADYQVVVASVKGGEVPIDPRSMTEQARPENTSQALDALKQTVAVVQIDPERYSAVFFPGGHGTMFDFPNNPAVQKIVESFLRSNRPTALVCHGPAALVEAVDETGTPLVKNRRVAAFTDDEERAVGLTDEVPFLLQSKLEALGANVVTADNFTEHVVVDGVLVTGQNPASSAKAGQELLKLLEGKKSTP